MLKYFKFRISIPSALGLAFLLFYAAAQGTRDAPYWAALAGLLLAWAITSLYYIGILTKAARTKPVLDAAIELARTFLYTDKPCIGEIKTLTTAVVRWKDINP